MNGKKRKNGIALVAMTLVLVLSFGCLVCYGGSDPISEEVDLALVEKIRNMADDWAKALETRDGKVRYDMMNEKCKAAFMEEQKAGTPTGKSRRTPTGKSRRTLTGKNRRILMRKTRSRKRALTLSVSAAKVKSAAPTW